MLSALAEAPAQRRSDGIALDIKTLRSTAYRLSVYDWRGMGLEMAQPRRRLWQSAAGQAVVGPCPPLAVEGP